jgi:hypothetical protein
LRTTGTGVGVFSSFPASEPTLKLYPNPATDMLTIFSPGIGTIVLVSPDGRELDRTPAKTGLVQIDVSRFQTGIYMARFISETLVRTGKFVKQ